MLARVHDLVVSPHDRDDDGDADDDDDVDDDDVLAR